MVCLFADTFTVWVIATTNKQLLSNTDVEWWDDFSMVQPPLDACSTYKNDYQVAVLALFQSPRTVPNVSVYGSDHHFQDQWLDIERCYLIFCIL